MDLELELETIPLRETTDRDFEREVFEDWEALMAATRAVLASFVAFLVPIEDQ